MQITKSDKNGIVVCSVNGDIDINSSPEVKRFFERIIASKAEKVLIDLKEVAYVDSSGLATIVEILKKMRVYGGKLKISNLSDKVRGLFEITRLDKLFDIVSSEEEALSSF